MSDLSHTLPSTAASLRLSGKTAIVTGGTRGIGRAVVDLFRENGAEVVFTGRDESLGAKAARDTGALFFAADANDADASRRVVEFTASRFGRLDILINNAGHATSRDSILAFQDQDLDDMIDIHVRAPWRMTSLAAPVMAQSGGGSIVNIASLAAHRVGANSIAYSVAKAALVHLTRHAASALGKDHIRVNSVSPGFVETEIHTAGLTDDPERSKMYSEAIARFHTARQAIPIVGLPADIASVCLFLASDESRFMTGSDLPVEGATMWGQVAR